MTDTIPVGPELDKAVCKAIGIEPNTIGFNADGSLRLAYPPVSRLVNRAFEAAEKAGLFRDSPRQLWRPYEQWFISEVDDPMGATIELGTGATPAEAICRAILHVKTDPLPPTNSA